MTVRFIAVGDVAPDRADPDSNFDSVRDILTAADLGFCQLEVNLTRRGTRMPQARHTMRGDPAIAGALMRAGFHVVSFAGNHCMDWGPDGMADTLENLAAAGAVQVGCGANIAEARKPAIIERNGLRIGFVSVNSILPMAYWADERRPGCAPLRAFTHYEQIEHDQPGTPARIRTWPQEDDLGALLDTIRALRREADVVILSHHAGIHFTPAIIPDYQRIVAHAAIDAGADMVLGTHAHILKGAEFYKGKPIFYSLCNFAMDLRMDKAHAESKSFKEIQKLSPDWVPDFDSLYNFPPDSAMSLMVQCDLTRDGVQNLRLLPVWIGRDANPVVVSSDDFRFEKIRAYMQQISEQAGLATDFAAAGDAVVMSARA